MIKINLSSNGCKFVSVFCSIVISFLWFFVCFIFEKLIVTVVVFFTIMMLICMFSLYMSFSSKIIIKNSILIINHFKKYSIEISDIEDIYVDNEHLMPYNLIYISTKNKLYKITGYVCLSRKYDNVEITTKIVKDLKNILNLK